METMDEVMDQEFDSIYEKFTDSIHIFPDLYKTSLEVDYLINNLNESFIHPIFLLYFNSCIGQLIVVSQSGNSFRGFKGIQSYAVASVKTETKIILVCRIPNPITVWAI